MGRFLKIEFPEIKNTVIEITNSRWVKQLIRYLKREQINWMIDLKKLTGGGHCLGTGKAIFTLLLRPQVANRAWQAPPSLYENPWTIPDMLSMRRIGLAPVWGYLIISYCTMSFCFRWANWFVGWIYCSILGQSKISFCPLVDKIPICTTYISLTYADLSPAPLTSVIVSKDAMLTAVILPQILNSSKTERTC